MGGERNVLLAVSLDGPILLAQEVPPLPPRIYDEDCKEGSYGCNKKHFHDPRIARSHKGVLYNEFTGRKQKCNCLSGNWNGKEKRTALPFDALGPDFSLMGFDDMFRDGQSQPCPAAGTGFIDPVEALEDA